MRTFYISMLLICTLYQGAFCKKISSQSDDPEPLFKELTVKQLKGGRICDTCSVEYVHHADVHFGYVITGAGHTPSRLSYLRDRVGKSDRGAKTYKSQVHIISGADISLIFLPNFLMEKGKRIQLYRNYSGADYRQLEFSTTQNGRRIRPWTPITSLEGDKGFAVLGSKTGADQSSYVPWGQTFSAGSFHLAIRDTVVVTIRNILTKKTVQTISVYRAEDKPTNFVYYQVPLTSNNLSQNIQNMLNISAVPLNVSRGDTLSVFEKDYASIGVMRFLGLNRNEQLEYSFKTDPYSWQPLSSIDSENGVFLVLGNDMEAGKDQDVYLRFKTQPETIHKVTVKVKKKPFHIQWRNIAAISIFLLAIASIAFYIRHTRSQRKVAALKRKSEDTEAQLALLSGQLNPHFLFNSLNAIQGTIISGDPKKVNTYIGNIAGFMRDVMDNGKKEFISLQEELKMEADYLKLENERNPFTYTVDVSEGLIPTLIDIPPLLLQPALENSIRHAFGPENPNPLVSIHVSRAVNNLIIKVSDTGRIHWDTHEIQYGHGLSLTRKRIAVYNEKLEGMSVQMEINYVQGSGTTTIFTFQDWLA